MRRIIPVILVLFLLSSVILTAAFAGGRGFIGIGGGAFTSPGAFGFSHHRGSRPHFFFHFGNPSLSHPHFGSGAWGYNYSPTVSVPYPVAPQQSYPQGFSGTDPNGALYVDGYRVLPSGWLRIQVEPPDAQVLIDGFPITIDQVSRTTASVGLPVGIHSVRIAKTGFQAHQSDVEIRQGKEVLLSVKLRR